MKVDVHKCDLCGKQTDADMPETWRILCECVGEDDGVVEWDICPGCQRKPISALVIPPSWG